MHVLIASVPFNEFWILHAPPVCITHLVPIRMHSNQFLVSGVVCSAVLYGLSARLDMMSVQSGLARSNNLLDYVPGPAAQRAYPPRNLRLAVVLSSHLVSEPMVQ